MAAHKAHCAINLLGDKLLHLRRWKMCPNSEIQPEQADVAQRRRPCGQSWLIIALSPTSLTQHRHRVLTIHSKPSPESPSQTIDLRHHQSVPQDQLEPGVVVPERELGRAIRWGPELVVVQSATTSADPTDRASVAARRQQPSSSRGPEVRSKPIELEN